MLIARCFLTSFLAMQMASSANAMEIVKLFRKAAAPTIGKKIIDFSTGKNGEVILYRLTAHGNFHLISSTPTDDFIFAATLLVDANQDEGVFCPAQSLRSKDAAEYETKEQEIESNSFEKSYCFLIRVLPLVEAILQGEDF